MVREISKKDLLSFVKGLDYIRNELTNYGQNILYTLEHLHYVKVLDEIKKRKDKLDLFRPNQFVSFYMPEGKTPKDICMGCQSCLANQITHIRHSDKCNCSCDFCYLYGKSDDEMILPKWAYMESLTRFNLDEDEIKLMLSKQVFGKVHAIGWLQKEPLLEMEKMKPIMEYISSNGIYQYLYTNGILATSRTLELLKRWGLNEIRFNLQASDFTSHVLKNLQTACSLIEHVCIETPIFSKSYNNFLKHKDFILNCGVEQINMPELQVNPHNLDLFKDEGPIYRHRRGYTSPISSRHYVYDLIEIAIKEKWNIIINDCSNDTKFFRGVQENYDRTLNCKVNYMTDFKFLPTSYYQYVVDNYVDDALTF